MILKEKESRQTTLVAVLFCKRSKISVGLRKEGREGRYLGLVGVTDLKEVRCSEMSAVTQT